MSITVDDQHQVLMKRTWEAFHLFDRNKDGTIDFSELRLLLQSLDDSWTDWRVERLLEAADLNKDKLIQFDEFLRWVFAGGGEAQADFRQAVGLEDVVQPIVTVLVREEDGSIAFGPEELLGSFTVGHLRRRVSSEIEHTIACFCSDGCILRDSMELGVYGHGEVLELKIVEDAFSLLTDDCVSQLTGLRALGTLLEQRCTRMGWSRDLHEARDAGSQVRRGEEHGEILLLPNGQILAKHYSYVGVASPQQSSRLWKYEIAEGTFSILDPREFLVEIYWRRWAERRAYDENADAPPKRELLQPWAEKEVHEFSQPCHLLPTPACKANILNTASKLLSDYVTGKHVPLDADDDPLAGLPMPGIDGEVLSDLMMDESHADYWRLGAKHGGPEAFSGRRRRTSRSRTESKASLPRSD